MLAADFANLSVEFFNLRLEFNLVGKPLIIPYRAIISTPILLSVRVIKSGCFFHDKTVREFLRFFKGWLFFKTKIDFFSIYPGIECKYVA